MGERGIALVAVLWVLVLLALLAANFTRTTRTGNHLARNLVANAEARALADAGFYRAVMGLLEADRNARLAIDGTVYRMAMADGEVLLTLHDEGGKIDLNRAPETLLAGLFQAVGLSEEKTATTVDAILDYRDFDDDRRPNGAEDGDYAAAGLEFGAKDARFEAIEELKQVLGVSAELYRQVATAITVHGHGRRINQATAPPLVLRAIPGLSEQSLNQRLSAEEERGATPLELSGSDDGDAAQESTESDRPARTRRRRTRAGAAVTIRAEARTAKDAVFIREAIVRTSVRRARSARRKVPYEILAWRTGQVEPRAGKR